MRLLTLILVLSATMLLPTFQMEVKAADQPTVQAEKTEAQVVGIAATYSEAFKLARAKLPAGKYHHRVTTKKEGKNFVVTLYYYE